MRIEFDWDPAKAASNRSRHGVAFEDAMAVFLDPLALSKLDEDSSDREERWITIGGREPGRILLVVHTYSEITSDTAVVRIISARPPTRREVTQYEEGVET